MTVNMNVQFAIFFGKGVPQGYRRRGFFCQQKLLIEEKKWDTDNWDCNKTVLLSVAVDAVVTI